VRAALDAGLRLVDCAAHDDNEEAVGRAVRDSGVPRDKLVVVSKMRGRDQGWLQTPRALEESLSLMGLDYLDFYLIQWPMPRVGAYRPAYEALVALRAAGRLRSIGVSNFGARELETVIADTGVVPALNQVELHPTCGQRSLRAVHERLGVRTQAWRPLGFTELRCPVVVSSARRIGATPAQTILAWHAALGIVTIPKSSSPERQRENLAAITLVLPPDLVATLSALDLDDPILDQTTFEEFD
jgi:2,5-diketo-D-gluconate reductase A